MASEKNDNGKWAKGFAQVAGKAAAPNILVVGSSVMDQVMIVDRLGKPGETVPAGDPDYGFGGKGANQAVAAALSGAKVSMVSCVGNDSEGEKTIANFVKHGIDVSGVEKSPTRATGLAPIFIDRNSRQNQIYVSLGANEEISPQMVDQALAKGPKPDAIIMQCEMPIETVYHTVARAKEQGITTLLNVAPAREVELDKLAGLNYLVVNENEAERVSGKKVVIDANSDDPLVKQKAKEAMVDNAIGAAKHILENSSIRNVIVTLGSLGVVLVNRQRTTIKEPYNVNVVDTSGAGDAWLGSFTAFLAQGMDEAKAMEHANLFAGLSTEKPGTQKSYPNAAEFTAAVQEHQLGANGQVR